MLGFAGAAVAGDRGPFATPLHVDLARWQAFADEIVSDCLGTLLREPLVIGIRADAVGIADHGSDAIRGPGCLNLTVEGIQRLPAFRFEGRLVEVKQYVRAQGELLLDHDGLRGRCRRRGCYHRGDLAEAINHGDGQQTIVHAQTRVFPVAIRRAVLVFEAGSPIPIKGIFCAECPDEVEAAVVIQLIAAGPTVSTPDATV